MKINQINYKNVKAYIQGNFRYRLYYSKYKYLISKHILEQIECRINSMNIECFNNGSCIMCGCKTTHLQMANKTCESLCYPDMLSVSKWKFLKKTGTIFVKGIDWKLKNNKFTWQIGKT